MVSWKLPYLLFFFLIAAERLVELFLSSRNAKWAFARGAVEVGQRHYRVMAVFHALFLAVCSAEVIWMTGPAPSRWGHLALAGAVVAQLLRYWAIATLGQRWNVRVIVLPGEQPISSGPYRWIRHPNYVAVALELTCLPLVYGAWWTALIFSAGNAALLRVRIRAEEQALGEPYARIFAKRPRFVPTPRRG